MLFISKSDRLTVNFQRTKLWTLQPGHTVPVLILVDHSVALSHFYLCFSGEDAGDPVRVQVHRDVAGHQPQRGRAAGGHAGADRAQGGGQREGAARQGRREAQREHLRRSSVGLGKRPTETCRISNRIFCRNRIVAYWLYSVGTILPKFAEYSVFWKCRIFIFGRYRKFEFLSVSSYSCGLILIPKNRESVLGNRFHTT